MPELRGDMVDDQSDPTETGRQPSSEPIDVEDSPDRPGDWDVSDVSQWWSNNGSHVNHQPDPPQRRSYSDNTHSSAPTRGDQQWNQRDTRRSNDVWGGDPPRGSTRPRTPEHDQDRHQSRRTDSLDYAEEQYPHLRTRSRGAREPPHHTRPKPHENERPAQASTHSRKGK